MTQYPGADPDDPFSRPPNEQGSGDTSSAPPPPPPDAPAPPPLGAPPPPPPVPPTDETAPIQREELGYWEKQALERQGETPPPPTPGYVQNPTSAQGYGDAPGAAGQPESSNPWSGYGEPAAYGAPPAGGGVPAPPNPYSQPAYGYPAAAPNHPQSTTVLVLGIVSLVCCGLAGPFAWVMGGRARREIKAANGQLGGEGAVTAGWIMGIIATVLMVLGLLAFALLLVVGLATGTSSGSTQF